MRKNALSLETEGFQRSDLNLFVDGDPMHRRHHRQNADSQKQARQDRPHRLTFFDFRLSRGIGGVLFFRQNQRRLLQRFFDRSGKLALI